MIVPPGPRGYIDGTRPYFRSVGQSARPNQIESLDSQTRASRQASSRSCTAGKDTRGNTLFDASLSGRQALPPGARVRDLKAAICEGKRCGRHGKEKISPIQRSSC